MEDQFKIRIIKSETEIVQCWDVALLLRPHLKKDKWVSMITEMMENEKYSIAGVWDNDWCIAFAGYRFMTSLHSGSIIYVDDLFTLDEYRGKGLATELLQFVREIAIMNHLDALVLDTDFTNDVAQKVYLRNGFKLAALHLASDLRK